MVRTTPIALALAILFASGTAHAKVEEEKAQAWAKTLRALEEELPELDDRKVNQVKGMATAGYIISLAGAGLMIASWIAYFPDLGAKGGDLSPTWVGLMSAWGATSAVGIPLLLVSNYKARKMMNKPPVAGYFIAGWFFLGVGYASLAFIDAQPVYTMLYATIGYVASLTWSMGAAGRAINRLRNIEKKHKERETLVMPYVTGVPGGAMAGLSGAF